MFLLWSLWLNCAIYLISIQSSSADYLILTGNLKHKDLLGKVVSSQAYADGDNDIDEEAHDNMDNNMEADVDEQAGNSDQGNEEAEWSAWFNSRWSFHLGDILLSLCVAISAPMNVYSLPNCI